MTTMASTRRRTRHVDGADGMALMIRLTMALFKEQREDEEEWGVGRRMCMFALGGAYE